MNTTQSRTLRRQQLDRALADAAVVRTLPTPRQGWIAEVRGLLGMRAAQLARRLGSTQAAISKLERSEARGTITLNRLRQAAEALDCQLVYAFVPNGSFEALIRERAEALARREIARVGHTMALEDQRPDDPARAVAVATLAAELVRTLDRQLWDETP